MHIAIDITAAILLLIFILGGWRRGTLLSLLGIVRIVLAYGLAYFAGRYLGHWLGPVVNRPRIVLIPMIAGVTFLVVTLFFYLLMNGIRYRQQQRKDEEKTSLPLPSRLSGGVISLASGLFILVLFFWLADLMSVGWAGRSLPGAEKSVFARMARRMVYEGANVTFSRKGNETQATAAATVVSNPAEGKQHIENLVHSDSFQQLVTDRQFGEDMMSGDPEQIAQNASLHHFFNDREALEELRALGFFAGDETRTEVCEALSKFGSNETIQQSVENLKERDMLSIDKIHLLIRDPDFDVIIGELLK